MNRNYNLLMAEDSNNNSSLNLNKQKPSDREKEAISFLCFDLSPYPKSVQFILLTILTFVFFLLYGYLQELLYKLDGFSDFSWFLTLVQFFCYSVFAFIEALIRNDLKRK